MNRISIKKNPQLLPLHQRTVEVERACSKGIQARSLMLFSLAHLSRRLIGELKVQPGIRRPSVVVNIFKRHLLRSHAADSYHISHIESIGRGTNHIVLMQIG